MQEINGVVIVLFIFMAVTLCLLEASHDLNSWLIGSARRVLVLRKRKAADESTASGSTAESAELKREGENLQA